MSFLEPFLSGQIYNILYVHISQLELRAYYINNLPCLRIGHVAQWSMKRALISNFTNNTVSPVMGIIKIPLIIFVGYVLSKNFIDKKYKSIEFCLVSITYRQFWYMKKLRLIHALF